MTQRALILRALRIASFVSCMLGAPAALSAPPNAEPPAAQDPAVQDLLREGERLWRVGDFKAAREPLEKANSLAEEQGDSYSLARGLNLLGNTVWGFGDYSGAVSLHRRALKLFRDLGKKVDEAKALNNIGNDLNSMGDYQQALSFFHQSVKAAERAGAPLGVALSNIGIANKYLGHYAKAVDYLQRALRLQKKAGEIRDAGLTLNQLGIVGRARGEYEQALAFYRESLEYRRKASDRRGEAQTLINMASVYGDLGQSDASLSYSAQALAIADEIGYAAGAGIAQMNIGQELGTLGRFEEALARCEKALSLFRQINRRTSVAEALFNIGELHREGDRDLAASRRAYLEALDVTQTTKDPEAQGFALDGLAVVSLRDGAPAEALGHLEEALALARSTHTPSLEFRVRADRARALKALGRHQEAFAEFEASARIANDLRSNLKSDRGKVGFLDSRQAVFTDWAEALLEAGRDEQALEVAEAGRARAIADLLAQRRVRGKAGERVILEQVRTTLEELGATARSKTGDLAASASEGSKIRGPGLDQQLARLRSQNRELASLITVESPKAKEIRGVATRLGAAIVEYLAAETSLFIWVVQPSGAVHSVRKDVGRESLASSIKQLRRQIDEADADALQHPEGVRPLLRTIDAMLFESIEPWLPAPDAPVVVVPHGPLWLVPFAALEDAAGKSLAERHALCFVPSVSVFRYTGTGRASAAGVQRALIVADPVPPHGSGLPALAGSRAEAIQIQARLGPSRAHLLTGAEASEAAVKQRSSGYGILHFATHGLIAEDRPLESSLALAEGNGEDGYLRVDEVFSLDLKADLVVLSGCSTGLGRLSGDGVLGLTRAFLYAGTRSLVVSQWDVSDRATGFLMDRFYAELEAGRGKVAALRAAQLSTKERWPHPALWAAFELVGEPR